MRKHTLDQLWKAVLEDFFADAIRFFRPRLFGLTDWSRQPVFLDKELRELFPDAQPNERRADLVAKVWLRTGEEAWVIVHFEVQGQPEPNFSERMFDYFLRLRERHRRPIFALAILTDPTENWRPRGHREAFMGTSVAYRFPIFKVLDWPPERLPRAKNPFSTIIETAYFVAKTYGLSDETKRRAGLELVKRLLKKGYEKGEVKKILHFIRFIFRFREPDGTATFVKEISDHFQKEKIMSLDEIIAIETFEEGREKGLEEGIEKGIEKGSFETARRLLLTGMEAKLVSNVTNLPLEKVKKIEAELLADGNEKA